MRSSAERDAVTALSKGNGTSRGWHGVRRSYDVLGCREAIAGVEHALMGMKVGGYRKVRVSPHLAYRDKGIPDLVPPDAVLIVELWLRAAIDSLILV